MRRLVAALLLYVSGLSMSHAGPIYVSCEIERDGESWGFDATLNESDGTVAVTKGGGFIGSARFSPTEVRFVETDSYGTPRFGTTTFVTIRSIDRTDLSATLEWKVLSSGEVQEDRSFVERGQCEIVDPPPRAF